MQYFGGYNANGVLGGPTCDTTFTEMYSYGVPGAPVGKRLRVTRTVSGQAMNVDLNSTYAYDNEGRMTSEQYPNDATTTGPDLGYTFDSMGRLNAVTDLASNSAIIGELRTTR